MQHHPDKNPDNPEAHETFQKIGQAYETLSSPNDRATYDSHGPDGPPRGGMGGGGADMDDIFEQMFGGFGMGGGFEFDMGFDPSSHSSRGRRKPTKGRDTTVPYDISLEDAYKGKKVVMNIERDRICTGCKGSGARPGVQPRDCGNCEGKGIVFTDRHIAPGLLGKVKSPCPSCNGEGKKIRDKEKCKKCKGLKVTKEKKRIEFMIEPGTEDGERIALRGEGDEEPEVPAGDIIFLIRYKIHPSFKPQPNSIGGLSILISIRLSEALIGFSRILFIHLDGRGIKIESKKGERIIKQNSIYIIKNEGMPIRGTNKKGDIFIKFDLEFPTLDWAKSQKNDNDGLIELPGKKPDLKIEGEIVKRELSLNPIN
nr:chaperone regulator [Kwoniella pini CBS 10737]OCF49551.1 chaperone regulator [Kwoniella pini CBS 10737]